MSFILKHVYIIPLITTMVVRDHWPPLKRKEKKVGNEKQEKEERERV